jgi:hypothetical protein
VESETLVEIGVFVDVEVTTGFVVLVVVRVVEELVAHNPLLTMSTMTIAPKAKRSVTEAIACPNL